MKINMLFVIFVLIGGLHSQTLQTPWFQQLRQSFESCQSLEQLDSLSRQFEAQNQNRPQRLIAFYQIYSNYVYVIAQKYFISLKTDEEKEAFALKVKKLHEMKKQYLLKADQLCQKLQGDSIDEEIQTFCKYFKMAAGRIRFERQLKEHQPLPDFEFTDSRGQQHKLSDFRGRYVLLHFWNMHSKPCVDELTYLLQAFNQFDRKKIQIISIHISVGKPDLKWEAETLSNLIQEMGLNWIQVSGEQTQAIKELYFVRNFPTLYLLDAQGRALKSGKSLRESQLIATLSELFTDQ
ncbi:alkyl hydroperoxide reductase/ Thiol specific antioxidant/ Mal allergen [Caldithrix abyssi DSM 13497]|uniref:Alkyl hydroperoxide reductase/ Thiol specific antioxidant/ Mal allergen n=1 Tax=Caldithrix abyssi DSM 13497 TaxID=880073 RepID=H1XRW1_CALAY|nr:redoxin domain-containing protein [Caldithrix abyssi]APF17184.1 Peroxiredoxin [Caldithrix abyssi DSM 13497]EHO41321.1 alkyl hydroperoxide reductase/ Thiol specific antioxidant/ Mal allergen [Caldithrix abyssi DSM 13497]